MPRTKKPEQPKLPTNVADCIDAYYEARMQRLDAQKSIDPLAERERALKDHIMKLLRDKQLQGAKGHVASAEIVRKRFPQVTDMEALVKFAKRKGNDDLVKVSMYAPAVQQRWNAGLEVPGVGAYEEEQLSIHKAKEK